MSTEENGSLTGLHGSPRKIARKKPEASQTCTKVHENIHERKRTPHGPTQKSMKNSTEENGNPANLDGGPRKKPQASLERLRQRCTINSTEENEILAKLHGGPQKCTEIYGNIYENVYEFSTVNSRYATDACPPNS